MSAIEIEELAGRLGELVVIDVRAPHEFDGSFGASCDPRQGHIPGARNLNIEEMMLLRENELRDWLGLDGSAEVVAYCHSGSRSALAVRILAGLGYNARNYSGSWHEWSRTDLPIESEGQT